MVKRHLKDVFETPSKRRRSASSPTGPPQVPARPCDSPSNPFGRKRVRSLVRSLPPPTPFSKHLPLRFQLVRTDRPSPRLHGGVHRVVQVPTNYTFMHLRSLIVFLFGGSCSMLLRDDPHLFEVKRKVELFGMNYKPGQVKAGQTWAKLSSTMDPCRYRPDHKSVDFEEEGVASSAESTAELFGHIEEEEPGEWKWHAEEDFTLERAWPKGCELMRAIVYHHDRTTQVHVTINTLPVDKRKGCSNTPYVFSGRGIVALTAPIVVPKGVPSKRAARADTGDNPTHSHSLRRSSIKNAHASSRPKPYHRPQSPDQEQNLTDQDAEGEPDPEASHFLDYDPWSNGSDDSDDVSRQRHEPDNVHATFDPDASNRPQRFPRFFSRCQRLARTRLQFGSSFGMEYDLTSSDDEQEESDRNSTSPNILRDSSSPVKRHSSPATSLFGSVPPTTKFPKARNAATPPPQTSSPGPSSPVSSLAFSKPSTSHQPRHFIPSSPGNIFDTWTNVSPKKRRHSSLFSHLPFHPSPSGFPKYTPLPARGKLYRMRIKRIEKRVERMKSLEWLRVPDEDEERKKGTKKEEGETKVEGKAMGEGKGKGKGKDNQERRAAPGGVLEMGVSRGKRPMPKGRPGTSRVSSKRCPVDDEQEV